MKALMNVHHIQSKLNTSRWHVYKIYTKFEIINELIKSKTKHKMSFHDGIVNENLHFEQKKHYYLHIRAVNKGQINHYYILNIYHRLYIRSG